MTIQDRMSGNFLVALPDDGEEAERISEMYRTGSDLTEDGSPLFTAEKSAQDTSKGTLTSVWRSLAPANKSLAVLKSKITPIDRERNDVTKEAVALRTALSRVFMAMKEGVLQKIRTLNKADHDAEFSFEEWVAEVEGSIEKHIISAVKKGTKAAYQQLSVDNPGAFTLANEVAVEWAKERSAELVGMTYLDGELVPNPRAGMSILDSTREMIRSDVSQALDEGWSTAELSGKLEDNFAFSEVRAEMIARTETARADVQGSLIWYKESGVVERKQWIVGDGCCEECQLLDGVQVSIDEEFPNEGGAGPPLHPQCRCDVLPVVQQINEGEAE